MQRIAIIGSSEQQNPLILKAHEMGFETHVFAWQTGVDIGEKTADYFYPVSTSDKEEILKIASALGVKGVISIGSDMAACSAAYCAEKLGLVTSSYESVCKATNKIETRKIFAEKNIKQPNYTIVEGAIPKHLNILKYPLVVKPSDRSASRGLNRINSEDQILNAISIARETSFERKVIIEEYIEGNSYSCECISYNGINEILGITKRTVKDFHGTLQDCAYQMPAFIPSSLNCNIKTIVDNVLHSLGITYGASSIEFIVRDTDAYIIEVSPTMYADYVGTFLIPETTGYDYLKAVIDIACGVKPQKPALKVEQEASVTFRYLEDGALTGKRISTNDISSLRCGHQFNSRKLRSIGGCRPWQINSGKPFYYDKNVLALDSEYTAFDCVLQTLKSRQIYVPYYISPSWLRVLEERKIEPIFYNIDDRFCPLNLKREQEQDPILLINFNDQCRDFIHAYVNEHENIIIDNSMAFFAKPIIRAGIYNIYSCRKFFPVPDGGYLISQDEIIAPKEKDISYKRARTLLLSLELGEQAAYKELMANEQELGKSRKRMSVLTEKLLSTFNYEKALEERKANYQVLHNRLKRFNLAQVAGDGAVPQYYPLLVEQDIRGILKQYNVFSPIMWRKLITDQFNGTNEKHFSEKMVFLPIDQQYSIDDMEYMATLINSLLT